MSEHESSPALGLDENAAAISFSLEINTNHRYKADEMGVLEFRIRNQGPRVIQALAIIIDCPCEKSRKKPAALKNIAPASEKRPYFQFEPARGGEALVEIEISLETEGRSPRIFRGQTSVFISSKDESRASPTSFNLNFHDIQKFMGNDLSGLLNIAGKEISEDRLRERMERKDPFWMRVDLEYDDTETARRSKAIRRIFCLPGAQFPPRSGRAVLEATAPSAPRRTFIYSTTQIGFGRHAQKNAAVLRFLPDYYRDERSKTISAEQFVARFVNGHCALSLAPEGRAPLSFNGRILKHGEEVQLSSGSEIKIGSYEFALKIACAPGTEDPGWMRTWKEVLESDPADDPFLNTRWDALNFARTANGLEEEYLWLLRKIEIGQEPGETAAIQLGQPSKPRARLIFWNGRYYLEALDSEAQLQVAGRTLLPGDVACLGAETGITLGVAGFHWKLI